MGNRRIYLKVTVIAFLVLTFFSATAWAIPPYITYQGQLTDRATGNPITDPGLNMTFRIYDEATAGALLWEENHGSVTVVNGIYNILLGAGTTTVGTFAPALFSDDNRWLEVAIGTEVLEPRQQITSAAYAFQAEVAKFAGDASALNGYTAGDFLSSSGPDEIIASSDGAILSITNTANGDGLHGFASGDGTNGVYGYAGGVGSHGMLGFSDGESGHGLHGLASGTGSIGVYGTGPIGVKGESDSGNAVVGRSTAPGSCGVFGNNTQGIGVKGQSDMDDGVVGWTGAGDKSGVYGHSDVGAGVSGRSTQNYGVFGATFSTDPTDAAVYGLNNGAGPGVRGQTASTEAWTPAIYGRNQGSGDGVYGWSQNRHGVFGVTSGDKDDAGVYGTNNGSGPAVKADGRLEVTGETIAQGDLKVSGAFKGEIGNGGAPFPRPAFVSEWVEVCNGAGAWLGVSQFLPPDQYNRENFVVDLQSMVHEFEGVYSYETISNYRIGAFDQDSYGACGEGVTYHILPSNNILIRAQYDQYCIDVRIRVWYYE